EGSPAYFPGAPFLGAGILVAVAAGFFVFAAWKFDLMHRPPVAKHPHHPDLAPPGHQATPPHEDDEPDELAAPRMQPPPPTHPWGGDGDADGRYSGALRPMKGNRSMRTFGTHTS